MSWYEHWIRRYEHRRWTTDDNRMVRPFEWGLQYLEEAAGGPSGTVGASQWPAASAIRNRNGEDPRPLLKQYSREATERSGEG